LIPNLIGFAFLETPLLTPRMAARIHDSVMNNAEQAIYLNWKEERLVPDLSKDAESFFKRLFQWQEDFTECYMRIGLRLHRGDYYPDPIVMERTLHSTTS